MISCIPFFADINVTSWLLSLLRGGDLLPFFLQPLPTRARLLGSAAAGTAADGGLSREIADLFAEASSAFVVFSLLQSFAFLRFVSFWQKSRPPTIMHFNSVRYNKP